MINAFFDRGLGFLTSSRCSFFLSPIFPVHSIFFSKMFEHCIPILRFIFNAHLPSTPPLSSGNPCCCSPPQMAYAPPRTPLNTNRPRTAGEDEMQHHQNTPKQTYQIVCLPWITPEYMPWRNHVLIPSHENRWESHSGERFRFLTIRALCAPLQLSSIAFASSSLWIPFGDFFPPRRCKCCYFASHRGFCLYSVHFSPTRVPHVHQNTMPCWWVLQSLNIIERKSQRPLLSFFWLTWGLFRPLFWTKPRWQSK